MGCKTCLKASKSWLMRNKLPTAMILGIFLGVAVAEIMWAARSTGYTEREIMYVGVLGEIYLQMLKGLGLILLPACLVFGFGNLDRTISRRIGIQMGIYYLSTNIIGAVIGLVFTVVIRPGSSIQHPILPENVSQIETIDRFMDMGRNMFPPNMIGMFLTQLETILIVTNNGTEKDDLSDWEPKLKEKRSINMLGITTTAIAAGIALRSMGVDGKPLVDAIYCISRATFTLTQWVMCISPVLIISLVAGQLLQMGGIVNAIQKLGLYFATVLVSQLTHVLFVQMLLYLVLLRDNPFKFITSMSKVLVTAFASSSSLGSLPMAIKQFEEYGYDTRLVQILMPAGTHLNKDGEAVGLACGALFVAQMLDKEIGWGGMATLVFVSIAASVSVVGVPRGSLVGQLVVLDALSLPVSEVTLLLTVDFIVDRLRTFTTVHGNCVAVAILTYYNRNSVDQGQEDPATAESSQAYAELGS